MGQRTITKQSVIVAVSIFGILVLFIFLQPKAAALLFPPVRNKIKTDFLQRVISQHDMNAQEFWQFREFYAPGHFTYNSHAADLAGGLILRDSIKSSSPVLLLSFSSPFSESWESIVSRQDWQHYVDTKNVPAENILFHNATTLIYQDKPGPLHIIFIKPIEEMVSANGFFNYTDQERKLLSDKYWLNQTWIY